MASRPFEPLKVLSACTTRWLGLPAWLRRMLQLEQPIRLYCTAQAHKNADLAGMMLTPAEMRAVAEMYALLEDLESVATVLQTQRQPTISIGRAVINAYMNKLNDDTKEYKVVNTVGDEGPAGEFTR